MRSQCTTAAFTLWTAPSGPYPRVLTRPQTEPFMQFVFLGSHLCSYQTSPCGLALAFGWQLSLSHATGRILRQATSTPQAHAHIGLTQRHAGDSALRAAADVDHPRARSRARTPAL